jgi:hypothetical protein
MDGWLLNSDVDSPRDIQNAAEVAILGGTSITTTEVTWSIPNLRWEMTINGPSTIVTDVTGGYGITSTGGTTPDIAFDVSELSVGGTLIAGDHLVAENGSIGNRQLISSIPLSIFNNDDGWTDNVGTVTLVGGTQTGTDVNGLTLSGSVSTSGNLTLSGNIDITDADGTLPVDHGGTGLTTVGANYLLTGNTTSPLTAESGLRFDSSSLDIYGTLTTPAKTQIINSGGTWVTNTSKVGRYSFYSSDGSGIGAREVAAVEGVCTVGGASGAFGLAFYTSIVNTVATEKVRIDDEGLVGIGTTSPSQKLEVSDTADTMIRINSTKDGTWVAGDLLGGIEFYGNDISGIGVGVKSYIHVVEESTYGAAFGLEFGTCNGSVAIAPRMTLAGGGNVGINDTSPSYRLDVNGTGRFTGALYANSHIYQGDSDYHFFGNSSDGSIFHNGSHLYINVTTGNFYLRVAVSETALLAVANGAVTIYHNNSPKFATTTTGIDVTGAIEASGEITAYA